MRNRRDIDRRRLLQGAAVTALGTGFAARPAFAQELVVGFIYVGAHDDYGYNQSHAEGAAAVRRMAGVRVLEQENVPEDNAVQNSMESMIRQDGATLLFPTSFGYFDPFILRTAPKYPGVRFEHAATLWQPGMPTNIGSYFAYIFEAQYISGIVAGHATKTKKLGFVAAKPIPLVLQNLNAFTLGARLVDPAITVQVIFTGDWSLPVKEAETVNAMADQGIDALTMHVDSPKVVVETAAKRGLMVCGYHSSQAALAPQLYLTGAEWNWVELYPKFVRMWMNHEPIPNMLVGAFKEGLIRQSPYGPLVTAPARQQADNVKAQLTAGTYAIFKGPISDNQGKIQIPAGKALVQTGTTDPGLDNMGFLVDGVLGSLPT